MNKDTTRRIVAEFFGTFWLTFGGCGAAVLAAAFPSLGIGFLGVSLAFGLSVLTMAYAVGHISGGHFNPAVTVGLWSAGRCANHHVLPYVIAQLIGAIVAAGSVATRSIDPFSIVAGNPAEPLRLRFNNEHERRYHLQQLEAFRYGLTMIQTTTLE